MPAGGGGRDAEADLVAGLGTEVEGEKPLLLLGCGRGVKQVLGADAGSHAAKGEREQRLHVARTGAHVGLEARAAHELEAQVSRDVLGRVHDERASPERPQVRARERPHEVFGAQAAFGEQLLAREQDRLLAIEALRLKAGHGPGHDADDEVDLAVRKRLEDALVAVFRNLNGDVRVALTEALDDRRQHHAATREGDADAQHALLVLVGAGKRAPKPGELGLETLGVGEEGLALVGETQRRGTLEQRAAELALHAGDVRGERLLRHVEPLGGAREAALAGDGAEVLHGLEVHVVLARFVNGLIRHKFYL